MAQAGDNDTPAPPRRLRWTKCIIVAQLALIAALVISHMVWGIVADHRFARACAPFIAAGHNLDWRTNGPPDIPDAQNAAVIYKRAAAQLKLTPRQNAIVSYGPAEQSVQDRYAAEADALVAVNASVLALCRQGRGLKANWGISHANDMLSITLPHLKQTRQLTRFLCVAAARQTTHGQSTQAIQTLLDMRALALSTAQDSMLIGHYCTLACTRLGDSTIEQIAPLLGAEAISAPAALARQPLMDSAKELLAALLNEDLKRSYQAAWPAEAAIVIDMIDSLLDSRHQGYWSSLGVGLPFVNIPWLFRPAFTVDKALLVEEYWRQRGEKPGKTSALLTLTMNLWGTALTAHWCVALLFMPSNATVHDKAIALDRLAAVRLALRLYELERGTAARTLEALVPEYLPAVPIDPMDPSGGPLRAVLDDPRPRIYSVGSNGNDDGGTEENQADEVMYLNPADRPQVDQSQTIAEIEAAAAQAGEAASQEGPGASSHGLGEQTPPP